MRFSGGTTLIPQLDWVQWAWTALYMYYVNQKCGCCTISLSQVRIYQCSSPSCPVAAGDLVLHPETDGVPTDEGDSGWTGKSGASSTLPYDTIAWDVDGSHPIPEDPLVLESSEATFSHEFMHVIGRGGHGGPGQPTAGSGIDEGDLCRYFEWRNGDSKECKDPGGSCCPAPSGPGVAITPNGSGGRTSSSSPFHQ